MFTVEHPNQKYCSPKCRILARKRQITLNTRRNRIKWKNIKEESRKEAMKNASDEFGEFVIKQTLPGKGTGSLGAHANTDFNEEQALIEKEMRRLKLKV